MIIFLILRIGAVVAMIALGIKLYDQFVKSKYANLFLLQIAIYIAILLVICSTDVLLSTLFRSNWLLIPTMINDLASIINFKLIYSDQLNCTISIIGFEIVVLALNIDSLICLCIDHHNEVHERYVDGQNKKVKDFKNFDSSERW